MFFCLVITFSLLLLATYIITKYPAYRKKQICLGTIPTPPSRFLLGHTLDMKSAKDITGKLFEWSKQYGSLFYISIGPLVRYVISDTDLIEYITSSNTLTKKAPIYKFAEPWLGKGLITSSGEKWRKRRKIITPTFHFSILEHYVDIFNKNNEILIEKLKDNIEKPSLDISTYVTLCSLDNICETAMGVSQNAQEKSDSEYVESVEFLQRNILARSYSLTKYFDSSYRLTNTYKKEQKCLNVVHGFTESVIKKRSAEVMRINTNIKEAQALGMKRKTLFLDLLLQSEIDGRPLSHLDIREEVDTFMFAGHDTTSAAISFTLYCLSLYPEVQQKVLEEVNSISGGDKFKVWSYADYQDMRYLNMVIKETLRIYPSIPFVAREVSEEFQYKGHTFMEGSTLVLFYYGAHMDPKNFEEPGSFKPERWLDEINRPVFSYLPFSAGPRNCVGQKFAILEIKSMVSNILMNFEILRPEDPQEPRLSTQGVLKSKNGIHIRLKIRES